MHGINAVYLFKNNNEFIATKSCYRIVFTYTSVQFLANILQQTITSSMSQAIVDVFEVIKIQKKNSNF